MKVFCIIHTQLKESRVIHRPNVNHFLHVAYYLNSKWPWKVVWFLFLFFPSGITTENDDEDEEQMRMFRIISEYCLPKLVCELHAKSYGAVFSESEKSLMSLIG